VELNQLVLAEGWDMGLIDAGSDLAAHTQPGQVATSGTSSPANFAGFYQTGRFKESMMIFELPARLAQRQTSST